MTRPSFVRSLRHAWRGARLAFQSERNFRIQLCFALAALAAAAAFPLTTGERIIVMVVTLSVLVLELLNTTVERLVDLMKPRLIDVAGDIKDLMAAAVLLASAFAVIIGLVIFLPYLISLLRQL